MSAWGQNAKYSSQADVFRFALNLGHCSPQPALRICATNGHRRLYSITPATWARIVGGACHRPRSAEFGLDSTKRMSSASQQAFDLAVTVARCESCGRVAECIASIRVGSIGKQLFHNINVTAIGGPHQRRIVDDVRGVAVSVVGKQNFDRCRAAVLRRAHQRGLAVVVPGVDISSVLEKHLHQLDVTSFGGKHKCRVAVAVARIRIGSLAKLGYRRLDVPLIRSRDHRFRRIIWLPRIILAHDNPPYCRTPLFETEYTSQISATKEESEQNMSLTVVLRYRLCSAHEQYRQDRTVGT